jgi:thiol-disulfide isomerase/thioredoxin
VKNQKQFSNKRRNFLLASGAVVLAPEILALNTAQAASNGYGIVGKQAPELKVGEWIDGKGKPTSFKLSDHKGKFVFLEFWQAWCPGCHKHGFPTLKKLVDEFNDSEHFVPVAIQTTFEGFSVNNAKQMRAIQMRYDLDIIFGHDEGSEEKHPHTMRSYRSGGTPWAVLISPEGEVLYNDFGIDPDGAVAFLKKAIDKLESA